MQLPFLSNSEGFDRRLTAENFKRKRAEGFRVYKIEQINVMTAKKKINIGRKNL